LFEYQHVISSVFALNINLSSGLRPRITCGWLTHGRFLFFARAKKRNQKKHAPKPPKTPCASRRNRRSPNSPGAEQRASGSIKSLATSPVPAAMLGGGYGDLKKPCPSCLGVFGSSNRYFNAAKALS
jgi:hypothetical protein